MTDSTKPGDNAETLEWMRTGCLLLGLKPPPSSQRQPASSAASVTLDYGKGYAGSFKTKDLAPAIAEAATKGRISAKAWAEAGVRLSKEKLQGVVVNAAALQDSLAGTEAKRLAEKQLAAVSSRLRDFLNQINTMDEFVESFSPDSNVFHAWEKTFPEADFDARAGEAGTNSTTLMLAASTARDPKAKELAGHWCAYWDQMAADVGKAKQQGAKEFDPTGVPVKAVRIFDATDPLGVTIDDQIASAPKGFNANTRDHQISILEQQLTASKANRETEEAMIELQACFDAPEFNPERERVGLVLQKMDALGDAELSSLSADQVKTRLNTLFELERTLFDWNDRRAHQKLPPSAEAVALCDMVQKAHLDITRHAVENKLPLVVADAATLSEQEKLELQANWELICKSSELFESMEEFLGSQGAVLVSNEIMLNDYNYETLANLARLLGTPAGRSLIKKLNAKDRKVRFTAGEKASCAPADVGAAKRKASTQPGDDPGPGSGSTVTTVLHAKDSDMALCTADGAPLFTPAFVIMGHELVHALHNARASLKRDAPMTQTSIWTNMEEYRTILTGKLSEQTLRAQYGLSAERFGHDETPAKQAVAEAYKQNLEVLQRISTLGDGEPDATLRGLGLDPAPLSITTKLAIADAKPAIKGPLPEGWDANLLSIAQLRLVIQHPQWQASALKKLGWSPLELDRGGGDTLLQVMTEQRAHPRSPDGLRYRSLGGDATLTALEALKFPGASDKLQPWPARLAALQAADEAREQQSQPWVELSTKFAQPPRKLKDLASGKRIDVV